MKCPNCQNQHRPGSARVLVCACKYRFAFDPKRDDGMTDGKFLALIRRVSLDDTQYYTMNQLYAQYCRRLRPGPGRPLIVGLCLAVLAVLGYGLLEETLGVILGIASLVSFVVVVVRTLRPPPKRETLQSHIRRWKTAGRSLDHLLLQPTLQTPPPEWDEDDIYDYGVERILIVEHNLLVDLFVLNEFHAQERTLVLSQNGYPSYLIPIAERCLQENPELPVYLLHDATPRGRSMASRLQNGEKLPLQGHPILDLGIMPDDVKRMRGQRALQPRRSQYATPIDYVVFASLSAMVVQGMVENLAFADLLLQSHSGIWDGGSGSGGDFDFG